jgi:shikimate kinase
VALVGLPGSGKSEIGALLADGLGCPFFDTDLLVEALTGQSIAELFASEGEAAFRAREAQVLEEVALRPAPLVASTGGGIVERADCRKLLASAFFTVWIRVEPEVALRRLEGGKVRPLLAGPDPLGALTGIAARREARYREVARLVLDNGPDVVPRALGDAIRAALLEADASG